MKRKILSQVYDRLFRAFGPQHWWPGETPFEVMVGAILTQNTNWRNAARAIANLKEAGLMEPPALSQAPQARLAKLIRPSRYFNVKARRLLDFLDWLVARTGDGNLESLRPIKTPVLRKELLNLRGIGPETADSILLYALGRRVFVVDAYTRRFLSRHQLIEAKATYEEIRRLLENSLPKSVKRYNEYHALVVKLGKDICRPKPRCEICPLRPFLGAPVLR